MNEDGIPDEYIVNEKIEQNEKKMNDTSSDDKSVIVKIKITGNFYLEIQLNV